VISDECFERDPALMIGSQHYPLMLRRVVEKQTAHFVSRGPGAQVIVERLKLRNEASSGREPRLAEERDIGVGINTHNQEGNFAVQLKIERWWPAPRKLRRNEVESVA